MTELMKEEEEEKAGREAKGLFENMMEYYNASKKKKQELMSPTKKKIGPASWALVTRRGPTDTEEKLARQMDLPYGGNQHSKFAADSSLGRDRTSTKDNDLLRSLFVDRILEMMKSGKNGMHDRPRCVKADDEEHVNSLR